MNSAECTECGYTHPTYQQCDEWIAGEWDCARCSNPVQLEDGSEMPRHRMCHGCATTVLDDTITERDELKRRVEELEAGISRPGRDPLSRTRTCEHCGQQTRITTAGCDHCDVEDK